MHIHFKFAVALFREIPITTPDREPVGKFAQHVKEKCAGGFSEFREQIAKPEGKKFRALITNEKTYDSPLFTAESKRGRLGDIIQTKNYNQYGLMLPNQTAYEVDLPTSASSWVPDCKGQIADLSSQYVIDLIENDGVYVAGPSGMTGLLLGVMEVLANLENVKLKQNYLSAIAAYIVGAGFHSLHEVIGPAEFALSLVPGYKISVPRKNQLAKPPNYHAFYKQQCAIDPEFEERLDKAWTQYISFFNHTYVPRNEERLSLLWDISFDAHDEIENAIKNYISDRAKIVDLAENHLELNFRSKHFCNISLMQEKLKIFLNFYKNVKDEYDYYELVSLTQEYKSLNIRLKEEKKSNSYLENKEKSKKNLPWNRIGLFACFDRIEMILIKEKQKKSQQSLAVYLKGGNKSNRP